MKETIILQLNKKKQEYETELAEFEQIRTLLTPCDGRTIKYLQNRLPEGMSIHKKGERTGITISATGNFHPISNNHIINVDGLEEMDDVHFTESKRHLADIENLLENPEKIQALADTYHTMQVAYPQLKNACRMLSNTSEFEPYNNPIYAIMIEIINVPSSIVSLLQEDKFK